MTEEERELLQTHAEEIAALPGDDPLRRALEESGASVELAESAEHSAELRRRLSDAIVPDLEHRLLEIPDLPAEGRNPWKALSVVFMAAAAVFAFLWLRPGESSAPQPVVALAEEAEPAEVVAVKFWHRTCPACREIDPRYAEVRDDFEEKPVLFVTFDMSTDETRAQSQMLAESLGIGDLYRDNFGVTGFVVLVDAESRSEVGRLTTQHDQGAMKDIINAALAQPRT